MASDGADQGTQDATKEKDMANWMRDLPARLLDVPLHELAIPGSHNSGTYQLHKDWGVGPDADQSVKSLSSMPIIGSIAGDIIHKWSKCQNLSIRKQLEAGVRYLDIRVALSPKTQELHFIHALYGPTIASGMEEVKSFLEDNQREVVLLDFNHFFDMELEHHLQLITYLMFVFEGMLAPYSSHSSLTLNALIEKGTRVVAFYHHGSVVEFPDLWPKPAIFSAWANTSKVDECLKRLEEAAKVRNRDQFHVTQAVLTPGTGDILQKMGSSLQKEFAGKMNATACDWMTSCSAVKEGKGMVYTADFVEEGGFVKSVVMLNE